jgi:isocitrate lyase
LLSQSDVGWIFIIYTVLAFLNVLYTHGMNAALFKFFHSSDRKEIITTSVLYSVVYGVVLSGLLLTVYALYAAYAPYADLVWCETGKPDLGFAQEYADAVLAENPNQLLAYNCSPSFNWKKNLNDAEIASFQEKIAGMGYKYQFITLAGIHNMWYNMFDLAYDYAQGEGMKHYVNKVQEPEFEAAKKGYTFASHQQEVGAGYFDDVTTVIQGGESSVTALKGSTEEEQFN